MSGGGGGEGLDEIIFYNPSLFILLQQKGN